MDMQQEYTKFLTRLKALNDRTMVAFVFVCGVFMGSLMGSLLPVLLILSTIAILLGLVWIAFNQFSQKGSGS